MAFIRQPASMVGAGMSPGGRHTMAPILILGIGNILLRDEGIGVRVIEATPADIAPKVADAYLDLKAAGRL